MKKRILITGSNGRFAQLLKKKFYGKNIFYKTKKQLNILKFNQILNNIKKHKINTIIHLAALSRPMSLHNTSIDKSIDINVIGTANIVKACFLKKIKLIYFSTNYVYPGLKGNYKESSSLLPLNNYAWSKLGGESSVQMYKNSLILRLSMTEKPFVHNSAFSNIKNSFMYQDDVIKILPKLINQKGIINVGGKNQSPYEFVRKSGMKIKKSNYSKKKFKNMMGKNSSINTNKLKKILNR